jgi:hypothetical protein
MFGFLKKLISDNVKVGQVWVSKSDNPFVEPSMVEIIERKENWIKIKRIHGPFLKYEDPRLVDPYKISEFKISYKLFKDVE